MAIFAPAATTLIPATSFLRLFSKPETNSRSRPCLASLSLPRDLHRPLKPLRGSAIARGHVCHAALSPQLPPGSDPPPEKNQGVAASLSRFRDGAHIFLAVLFWMSLFFWSSAWDGRNDG